MIRRHLSSVALTIVCALALASTPHAVAGAQAPAPAAPTAANTGTVVGAAAGDKLIQENDLRQWLTYLSSDLMQGREVFTEGYGLASSYIAEQLTMLGVKPLGQAGGYFQP